MMLGRVRAYGLTDNVHSIYEGIPDWNPKQDPWGPRDPFVFLSFFPCYISQVPKVDELIQIMYSNPRVQFTNQFYIQGPISDPRNSNFEKYEGADANLPTGIQYASTKPIKNENGTYEDIKSFGVFPEPGDNALLGRKSADVVVKEDELLLRAGKTLYLNPNELPVAYTRRSFIQLTQFRNTKQTKGFNKYTKLNQIIQSVKFLIEYNIFNPENAQNAFTGEINVYSFTSQVLTDDEFTSTKDYPNKSLKEVIPFNRLTMNETVAKINSVLEAYNDNTNTPYFFRFHDGDQGHSMFLGKKSSGKTILLNFVLAQARRFKNKIYYDLKINKMFYLISDYFNDNVDLMGERIECDTDVVESIQKKVKEVLDVEF
jgi:hypothetical protein